MIFDIFTDQVVKRPIICDAETLPVFLPASQNVSPEHIGDQIRVARGIPNMLWLSAASQTTCGLCGSRADDRSLVKVDDMQIVQGLCYLCKSRFVYHAVNDVSGRRRYTTASGDKSQICVWDSQCNQISRIAMDFNQPSDAYVCKSSLGGGIFVQFLPVTNRRSDYIMRVDVPRCVATCIWHGGHKKCRIACSRDDNLLAIAYSKYVAFVDLRQPSTCCTKSAYGDGTAVANRVAFITENLYAAVTTPLGDYATEAVYDMRNFGICVMERISHPTTFCRSVVV